MDHYQSPDDYDFASTRAINAPTTQFTQEKDHTTDELDDKKEPSSPYTQSVHEVPADNDLDPVALQKAFKFAANSSLVLVCGVNNSFKKSELILSLPDTRDDYFNPSPVIL